MEGCHKVVVDADIADVTFYATEEAKPRAVCHYYSHKTTMMYPFYTRQEGDTFYISIRRNQETEKKSTHQNLPITDLGMQKLFIIAMP